MWPFLLASMAASGLSGALKNKTAAGNQIADINYSIAQMNQDAAAAAERNRVRDEYLKRQDEWTAQNQGDLNTGIGAFMPDPQAGRLSDATANRGGVITGALGPQGGSQEIALRRGAPNMVTREIDKRVSEARDLARDSGMRFAKLGAYGDAWGENARSIGDTAHKIDTTNTIAKGNIGLLPQAQDLAEIKVRPPIGLPVPSTPPWWVDLLAGLGRIGGAYAGSQMGAASAPAGAQPSVIYAPDDI